MFGEDSLADEEPASNLTDTRGLGTYPSVNISDE